MYTRASENATAAVERGKGGGGNENKEGQEISDIVTLGKTKRTISEREKGTRARHKGKTKPTESSNAEWVEKEVSHYPEYHEM